MASLLDPSDWARSLALLFGGAASGVLVYRALQRPGKVGRPRLSAGCIADLYFADETWRDIRPHHLHGCRCAHCEGGKSHSPLPLSEAIPVVLTRAPSSNEWKQALRPKSDFGFRPFPRAECRPFKVYAGLNMSEQARIWRSATVDIVIAEAAARPVELPGENGVTFQTIFDMIVRPDGHTVYVYGGVLRDVIMKGPHVADDIDVLFTCSVKLLVERCEARGWKLGKHFHLKTDEATGALRYDYISIGKGKAKFSGHTLDSNCAGEFTFNCMLYDVDRKLLIDCSGFGLYDAAQRMLRIPYDGGHVGEDGKSQWELSSENCDRLPGMISLRFFNFRSRGYGASPETVAHNVRWLAHQTTTGLAESVGVFLKRKILAKHDADADALKAADERLEIFRVALCADFDQALGVGEGMKWWEAHVVPVAQTLRSVH